MIQVIGEILVPSLVVASSPPPVIAVVQLLLSPGGRRTAPAFVLGWVLGLAVIRGTVLAIADTSGIEDQRGEPSTTGSLVHLLIGVALLGLAWKQWKGRPTGADEPVLPRWMRSFDKLSSPAALGIGAFLSDGNPKTFVFVLAATTSIAQADLPRTGELAALLIFIVLSSGTVGGVVAWYFIAGAGAQSRLSPLSDWLAENNALIMSILLLVVGISQIGTGLSGLGA